MEDNEIDVPRLQESLRSFGKKRKKYVPGNIDVVNVRGELDRKKPNKKYVPGAIDVINVRGELKKRKK